MHGGCIFMARAHNSVLCKWPEFHFFGLVWKLIVAPGSHWLHIMLSFSACLLVRARSLRLREPLVGPASFYRLTHRMRLTTFNQNFFLPTIVCPHSVTEHKVCRLQMKLLKSRKIFNKTRDFSLLMQSNGLQQEFMAESELSSRKREVSTLRWPDSVWKVSLFWKFTRSRNRRPLQTSYSTVYA